MFTQDDNQQVILPTSDDSQAQSGSIPSTEPRIEDNIGSYEPPQAIGEDVQPNAQQSSTQSSRTVEDNLAELEKMVASLGDNSEKSSSDADNLTQDEPAIERASGSTDDSFGNNMPQNVQPTSTENSEALADQNIFFLLGAEKSSAQEQEEFLNELQATIWEDFLHNDMELLITSQEKVGADEITNNASLTELQKQEQLLDYLDNLIPDLETIMLEKALELKQDLVKERIISLKEAFSNDQIKLNRVQEVESLLSQGRWYSAGTLLNQIDQ